jgi:phage shock protein C
VVGGFADHFKFDPFVFRVIYVILLILSGVFPLIVLYVILALIMPNHGEVKSFNQQTSNQNSEQNSKEDVSNSSGSENIKN